MRIMAKKLSPFVFLLFIGCSNSIIENDILTTRSMAGIINTNTESVMLTKEGMMSVYMDKKLIPLRFHTFSDKMSQSLLDNFKNLNIIYTSEKPINIIG